MPQSFTYDLPQSLFNEAFVNRVLAISQMRPTLLITANPVHARWLKHHALLRSAAHVEIRTLQSALIAQLNSTKRRTVLSATGRGALVNAAWSAVAGPLYQQFGSRRGAVGEISRILTWISHQRHRWQHVADDLQMHHELARVYQHYCGILDAQDAIGYDDVALHVCDVPDITRHHEVVIACELQEATPAQLHALARLLSTSADDWVGAWVNATTHVPELRSVHGWLCQFNTPHQWQPPSHPAYAVSQRILGDTQALPQFQMIGMEKNDHFIAGAMTVVDECQTVARLTYERLMAGRQVDIICADDALIPQLRATFTNYGIDMPPLKPSTLQNPLIRMARGALRWLASHTADEQLQLSTELLQLPFMAVDATRNAESINAACATIDVMQAMAPQIEQFVQHAQAISWAWRQTVIPVDISDSWLRDYHQWLERIREIDRIIAAGNYAAHTRIQMLNNADALPTLIEELYRTTLPLHIHGRHGAAGASDCVILMGFSEHVAPRPANGYQLLSEQTLCQVFVEPQPAPPALTNGQAWREREARRLARLAGVHATEYILSFAHHASNGQKQLPSPYFERIAASMATFDRDGDLVVDTAHITIHRCDTLPLPSTQSTPLTVTTHLAHSTQFSATQVSTYLRCPRRYFFERVLHLGNDSDELDERSLSMGSLIHEILCAAVGTGKTSGVDLRNEAADVTRARWADMPQRVMRVAEAAWSGVSCQLSNGDSYTPTQEWRIRFGKGLRQHSTLRMLHRICTAWLAHDPCMRDPLRRPILLEQQLRFTLAEFSLTGQIDRIDEITHPVTGVKTYHIVDYKTGSVKEYLEIKRQFLPDDDAEATNYQIPIYLYGTQTAEWHLTSATDAMSLLFLNTKDGNVETRTTVVSEHASQIIKDGNKNKAINLNYFELLELMRDELVTVMRNMQYYPYPTKPSRSCSYCPYTLICDDSAV